MSDIARLDETIIELVATFDAELEQIQAELAKPKPNLSAQIEALQALRTRIAGVIPDPIPDEVPPADEPTPETEAVEDGVDVGAAIEPIE